MARRNRPGNISLDDIKLEGGIVVHVTLNKESGVFHARYDEIHVGENIQAHGGESWEGKDLEKIREDVKRWAKEKKALKWEAVIAVGPEEGFGMHGAHEVLGQSFKRLMRAKKHKGEGYEWRNWAYSKPGKDGSFIYDHDLEVYPPSSQASQPEAFRSNVKPIILEYTPERWLALLKLVEMEGALRKKLQDLVEDGENKFSLFLEKVPAIGLLGLAPDKKGGKA
jgi:hypothetical protein